VYMSSFHVNVYMTWFLVPLLSLLFCDGRIFLYAVSLNTALMAITTVLTAPYRVSLRADYDSTSDYLADVLGGYAIETTVLLAAGLIILKLSTDYLEELFAQNNVIGEQKRSMKEKIEILASMAEIYDNVNLIDFVEKTELSLRDEKQKKHKFNKKDQKQTRMNQEIMQGVVPEQKNAFAKFTDITTVRQRLKNRKVISAEFIDTKTGWFRAQYIAVDRAKDGMPNTVIYTIRNVDEDKRREERLKHIAMTDEMTRLYNRRRYDKDSEKCRKKKLPEDFVLFSVDVNGLKVANDSKGHIAGDEIIKGAAECIVSAVGKNGKVYRIGGDEFMAVVHSNEPEKIRDKILGNADAWSGKHIDKISLSVGYAAYKDNPEATVDKLEKTADADMYKQKEKYYSENKTERR
ncbi:MAG: GGDEF domain-containing protein, partial [Clostridia bacterium]|nr:GGDEF domain-containing protein [Clostridia bacterium]